MAQNRFTPERIVIAVVAVVVVASVALLIRRGVERDQAAETPPPASTDMVLPNVAARNEAEPRIRTTVSLPGVALYALALTPDGKQLVIAGSKLDKTFKDQPVVRLWNLEAGRAEEDLTRDGEVGRHVCLALSPDGKAVAAGGGVVADGKIPGRVSVWDVRTKKLKWSADVASQRVQCLAWTADGTRLAGGEFNGAVTVWSSADGKVQASWPASDPPAAVNAVAWSHDGKRLAFGDDGPLVRVWNVDEKRDITIRGGPISNLTFALDDKSVYFAGRTHDNVMLWELNTNRNSRSLATGPNGVSALALTLNGRSLVTATHQFFCCWEVSSGRELWALTVPTDGPRFLDRPFAISPDGRVLAIAKAERFDDDAIVWSVSIYDVPPLP